MALDPLPEAYDALVAQLNAPRPQVVAPSTLLVSLHPHTLGPDAEWPVAMAIPQLQVRPGRWASRRLGVAMPSSAAKPLLLRLPPPQVWHCALAAAELAAGVWLDWVALVAAGDDPAGPPEPSPRTSRPRRRAPSPPPPVDPEPAAGPAAEAVREIVEVDGDRPLATVRAANAHLARPAPPDPRALRDATGELRALEEALPPRAAGCWAVRSMRRAVEAVGERWPIESAVAAVNCGATAASRLCRHDRLDAGLTRAFLEAWWRRCRCRLAIHDPAGADLA